MTDYNNGEIWGWNGGECPVHHESVATTWCRGGGSVEGIAAKHFFWGHHDEGSDIVCFKVTKPYVEPKKIYVNEWPNGEMLAYDTEEKAKMWSSNMHCRIAVEYVEKQK
jgi:hypothetical protein